MFRLFLVVATMACSCGRIGFDPGPTCADGSDCDGLAVTSTSVNSGSEYATGPRLSVGVSVVGGIAPLEVRVQSVAADGDCQSQYADDSWQGFAGVSASYDMLIDPIDGEKKICVWARDSIGNLTVVVPAAGTPGVQTDSIIYSAANLPVVRSFSVSNAQSGGLTHQLGDMLRVEWKLSDVEGLADNPVDLFYTTANPEENDWTEVALGIGAPLDSPTETAGSYLSFAAPTTDPFRMRLVATDVAGNRSVAALSDLQNGGRWSVVMGSSYRQGEGSAKGARLLFGSNTQGQFAIDTSTGDAYAVDDKNGVFRMDGGDGSVQQLIKNGPLNLPEDGTLGPEHSVPDFATLNMGADNRLYIGTRDGGSGSVSSTIYQFTPATGRMRRYVGGGTVADNSATPDSAFVSGWIFDFDEDNTLYYYAVCQPAVDTSILRLMKVTQLPDGSAGSISVVAGNCIAGTPDDGPSDPLDVPLGNTYTNLSDITVWGRGSRIYYGGRNGTVWKIIDGQHYASDIAVGGTLSMAYDPITQSLFAAEKEIVRYLPNLEGLNGDTRMEVLAANTGVGDCTKDGVLAADACVASDFTLQASNSGTVYFTDGTGVNQTRPFRVRFVDDQGRVQTYLGAPSFHGVDSEPEVTRGRISGIHYKSASAPNQGAFGPGLYFVDSGALTFGYVDSLTQKVSLLWGNQAGNKVEYTSGDEIGPTKGLGVPYTGGNMTSMVFDDEGLPWMRFGPSPNRSALIRVDANRRAIPLQNGTDKWELAADGSDPSNTNLWPYGTRSNLTLMGRTALVSGSFEDASSAAIMKWMDFQQGTMGNIIGAAPNGFTADQLTPGNTSNSSLDVGCHYNRGKCWVQYRPSDGRLYFNELGRLRYVQTPANPLTSTLGTLWTGAPSSMRNFSINPAGSMLFYVLSGHLYCHPLVAGPSFCDDTSLGAPEILDSIDSGPNQLTWKDGSTLLISNYQGEVFKFDAGP